MLPDTVTITECPRDAFQGLRKFIPTDDKIEYLNMLMTAGARRIDFGSFVSPKAVPQMADTAVVFENMKQPDGLYLIAIIGNERGMEGILACNSRMKDRGRIAAAGYPLSVSPTFQQRNLGRDMEQSWTDFDGIVKRANAMSVDVICYLSMAFGNPYGDAWSPELVADFARRVAALGVTTISLADTIGNATQPVIAKLFRDCRATCPDVTFTAHFHSAPDTFAEKIDAALDNGCRLIDGALGGVGGCPFAKDELVGNVDTLALARHVRRRGFATNLDPDRLTECARRAAEIAARYGGA